nr:unnamed protein product [Naegleria fowleri]
MRSKYFTRTSTTACGGGGDCCSVIHHHKKEGSIPSVATNRCVCRGGDPGAESSTLLLDSTASRKDQMKNTNVRLHVTHKEMSRYFNASQITAARLLGVSVSTLKRRYKEVSNGSRWPYSKLSTSEKKKSIWFYINDEDENEKSISKECQLVLAKAFQNCTLPSTFYFSDLRKQHRRVIFYKYIPEHSNTTNQSTLTH